MQSFLTKKFHEHPYWVTSVFNNLLKSKLVTINDHYESGEFLSFWVKDCIQSREILRDLICDFKAYEEYYLGYTEPILGEISLCGLYEPHKAHYKSDEIRWYPKGGYFINYSEKI